MNPNGQLVLYMPYITITKPKQGNLSTITSYHEMLVTVTAMVCQLHKSYVSLVERLIVITV